jgi:hypothetical protein
VTRELFIHKTSNIKTTLDWFQNPGDLSVLHLSQANLASFLWEFIIRALANLSQSLTELATTKSFFSLLGKFTPKDKKKHEQKKHNKKKQGKKKPKKKKKKKKNKKKKI